MSKSSRDKGANAEREICRYINALELPGVEARRNLNQYQQKDGYDIAGVPDFAIEVKRYKKLTRGQVRTFWDQTVRQASANELPVLIYKIDRDQWRVVMSWGTPEYINTLECSLARFLQFLKRHYQK